MDYRDLIDTMRNGDPLDIVVQAYWMADAIETLLKERDAAVEQLSDDCCRCCSCIYYNRTLNDYPCNHCKEAGGMTDYWQWRGPREGGGA